MGRRWRGLTRYAAQDTFDKTLAKSRGSHEKTKTPARPFAGIRFGAVAAITLRCSNAAGAERNINRKRFVAFMAAVMLKPKYRASSRPTSRDFRTASAQASHAGVFASRKSCGNCGALALT